MMTVRVGLDCKEPRNSSTWRSRAVYFDPNTEQEERDSYMLKLVAF
jgi:hypothetical protein